MTWRIAKWFGEYPELEILTSKPILFVHNNLVYKGYYHTNGCFYSECGEKIVVNHSVWSTKEVTPWIYHEEFRFDEMGLC